MIGLDTSFIVAFEIAEHEKHEAARTFALERREEGFALSTQILTEFCHIVTDPRRFSQPLVMQEAVHAARRWWHSKEVTIIDADEASGERFLMLMSRHELGRKHLLDTMLAATYLSADVHVIVTLDTRDFGSFAEFAPIVL